MVAISLLLMLAWGQQRGELVAVRREAANAKSAAATTDGRLAELTAAEASLGSRVDGLFDPAGIIRATEPSVFTLVAGAYQGSAFVLTSGGGRSLLVTNFHVIRSVWAAGVRRVVVRSQGHSFNAAVTAIRPEADLAVLRVTTELPALDPSGTPPEVGQPVVSVGSPYGFGGTASVGIVSADRGRFLQFSAPVSPGSSGGPLLDGAGAVVGVAAAKVIGRGAEGLSFAIPIGTVCRLTAAC
jgi:S1-C subfamily serine protease